MPANILSRLTAKQLRRAAGLREQIDRLEDRLAKLAGSPTAPVAKSGRNMSAAARAKIAEAQRRRWAKHRNAQKKT